jgi:hypothetical protein
MDPDQALENLRRAIGLYHSAEGIEDVSGMAEAAGQGIEAAESLDGWLSGGGFPPIAWSSVKGPGWVRLTTP